MVQGALRYGQETLGETVCPRKGGVVPLPPGGCRTFRDRHGGSASSLQEPLHVLRGSHKQSLHMQGLLTLLPDGCMRCADGCVGANEQRNVCICKGMYAHAKEYVHMQRNVYMCKTAKCITMRGGWRLQCVRPRSGCDLLLVCIKCTNRQNFFSTTFGTGVLSKFGRHSKTKVGYTLSSSLMAEHHN
eukprot:1161304-Pelagomonas_calceolata.AAC.1